MEKKRQDIAQNRAVSLRARMGLGALALAAGAILAAVGLYVGLQQVTQRLDASLAAERRISQYGALSTQSTRFLVVASEAVQSFQSGQNRATRLEPVANQLRQTFKALNADLASAVLAAEDLGLDTQSRFGTQSLGLARMEAVLNRTLEDLSTPDAQDSEQLRTVIDSFAAGIDPLLGQAVSTEVRWRKEILGSIDQLRQRLSVFAVVIALTTVLITAAFYFGLIRPQLARLNRLRDVALQIGNADFAIALPETRQDEIGRLYKETNRMAGALASRQEEVQAEWARLNDTIAARTEDLKQANAQLAEIDENRRRFFADVSHELRTPLTVILMEAQLGQSSDEDPLPAFAKIEARAAKLNRRIDDLLRVARSENGQLALDPMPVHLSDLLRDVAEEVTAEIDNAGMVLQLADASEARLFCDPNWARQVLVSLLRNTIRHARNGGQVALVAELTGDMMEFSVIDNGPGIAPDMQGQVFERFTQADSTQNTQGFGIGLALARWVCEAQNGSIAITSPVLQSETIGNAPGTKISVRLPLADE